MSEQRRIGQALDEVRRIRSPTASGVHPAIDAAKRDLDAKLAATENSFRKIATFPSGLRKHRSTLTELAEDIAILEVTVSKIEFLDALRCIDWAGGDGALR
jgi:hypothetical protein